MSYDFLPCLLGQEKLLDSESDDDSAFETSPEVQPKKARYIADPNPVVFKPKPACYRWFRMSFVYCQHKKASKPKEKKKKSPTVTPDEENNTVDAKPKGKGWAYLPKPPINHYPNPTPEAKLKPPKTPEKEKKVKSKFLSCFTLIFCFIDRQQKTNALPDTKQNKTLLHLITPHHNTKAVTKTNTKTETNIKTKTNRQVLVSSFSRHRLLAS